MEKIGQPHAQVNEPFPKIQKEKWGGNNLCYLSYGKNRMGKSECKASLTLLIASKGLFGDGFFRPLAPPHSHRWGGEMELWAIQHRFALSQRLKWIREGKWDEAKENVRLWRRRFQEDALLKRLIGEFQGDYMLMETKLEEEYLETLRREDKSQDSEPTKK